jgi:hypothetical protein
MVLLSFSKPDSAASFDTFWLAWPEPYRIAKGAARREWERLRPTPAQAEQWTMAILTQRDSRKWRDGYVPSPRNWLRDERWDDPVEKVPEPAGYWLCPHQPGCHSQPWCTQFRDAADARKREKSES